MTKNEIHDKIGAMHQRFKDDEDSYAKLLNLLMYYSDHSNQYGQKVISALQDGLKNFERYLKIESALSPRSIIIEKKDFDKNQRAKGCYRVYFVMDDESVCELDSTREACHLLYILMLLYSQKNGLLADFFLPENLNWEDDTCPIKRLIKLIYPGKTEQKAKNLAKDLASGRLFTDTVQFMNSSIKKCLQEANMSDDLYWYMPDSVDLNKKHLYKIHMPQANIIYPEEFLPIVDSLVDAVDFLSEKGIEVNRNRMADMRNNFAKWRKVAEQGDAEGLYYMGVYYGTGDVVSHDYKKSMEYYMEADHKGWLDATYQIGVYYFFGFGVEKDVYKALGYFERAAQKGHAEAAAWAGQIYERGIDGVKVNHKKAFNLYMIAASQGNEEAMWYVIQGYYLGQGTKKNLEKAVKWFEEADALDYHKIKMLWGTLLFNQGGKEMLDKAHRLFLDACNNEVPFAFMMMAKMVAKGYGETDDPEKEMEEWLLKGADLGDRQCINVLRKTRPVIYERHKSKWENTLSMHEMLFNQISAMDYIEQECFIEMVDAYRERWHEAYMIELCKQLSIHKPRSDGKSQTYQRRITIRKSTGGKLPYEVVLTLANGEEVIINKMDHNCMVLYLLAVICSYKSGYATKMAKSNACRPVLKKLARLAYDKHIDNLDDYVDGYMHFEKDVTKKKNEDYYKQYSNRAKMAIKKAVGTSDEAFYFLFDNFQEKETGRQNMRRMILDAECIEMPQELRDLASDMPDAMDVLKCADNQKDTSLINE